MMNTKHFLTAILLPLTISCISFADRPLDRGEILQILEKLTSQPRDTWISAGTIEAKHEEYRAPKTSGIAEINLQITEQIKGYQSNPNKRELTQGLQTMMLDAIPFNVRYRLSNKYTMNSNVEVRFDGDRFYWEINVSSRTDSVTPEACLAGNFMTDQFDLDWNTRRIFAWNGQQYTMYCLPANQEFTDTMGSIKHSIQGPLTAGVIPWGHGYCTYENLSAAETSAEEKDIDNQTQIRMTINNPDGSEMVFVMDPEKDYAVISASMNGSNTVTSSQYGSYQLVSGQWVPANISIEQYDAWNKQLLAYDVWVLTTISGETPAPGSFNIEYEANALIEYRSYLTDKPAMYNYSHTVDTDKLLLERLSFAASEGTQLQNCATAALKYAVSRSGKDVTDQQLAQLVSGPDKTTSLDAMKEFVQRLGLYCRAVQLDIKALQKLDGCEVILHIPEKNHFIVLGDIDERYVSSIDLTNNKFFYRTDVAFFDMDWTEGIALLVSDQPIKIQDSFVEIADNQLQNIIGGTGYSCTDLLQEYDVSFCDEYGGVCGGSYQVWFERWGCESAPSGSCSTSSKIRSASKPCFNDPYDPWSCDTGSWSYYYMRACD
ncbi:MAG: hypothetical protein H8D56_24875 [Planctomycetes bacterium]|nr:hypothetical protein [Planctomycetota bacterium]MBL7145213.1 hypothetical protein [Phycisphaerae bacterium]